MLRLLYYGFWNDISSHMILESIAIEMFRILLAKH